MATVGGQAKQARQHVGMTSCAMPAADPWAAAAMRVLAWLCKCPGLARSGHPCWLADPNSGGSSFSILLGPAPHLDMNYAIFGEVSCSLLCERVSLDHLMRPALPSSDYDSADRCECRCKRHGTSSLCSRLPGPRQTLSTSPACKQVTQGLETLSKFEEVG